VTTAEAISQIREALLAHSGKWRGTEPHTSPALTALDSLEAEIERLRAVVEAAVTTLPIFEEAMNRAGLNMTPVHMLRQALAATEEPTIAGLTKAELYRPMPREGN
jgi:hypothetical protein